MAGYIGQRDYGSKSAALASHGAIALPDAASFGFEYAAAIFSPC